MKPSKALIPLTLVAFLSCNKVEPEKFADVNGVKMGEVKMILQQDIPPINLLSKAAKNEMLENIVIDEGIIRGFNKTPLFNKELSLAQKTDLLEMLTVKGVVRHDAEGNEVYRSPKAH